MKKILLFLAVLFTMQVSAKTITISDAQKVALTFYETTSKQADLVYTQVDNKDTAFYVFNIETGFVIVSANDAANPILGYSKESNFVENPELRSWMNTTSNRITAIIAQKIPASVKTQSLWQTYTSGKKLPKVQSAVTPLCTTTWNQSPFYNDSCPLNKNYGQKAVTGCVATCMAQIMKYWNYPSTGTGTHSYNGSNGADYAYGTLSANFGAATYNWASMPNSIGSHNTPIAQLMYHLGVAVEMQYGVYGSGAWVISGDVGSGGACAQQALVKYFKYDGTKIKGVYESDYTNTVWLSMITGELDNHRPIEYVGWDNYGRGGHTWVCDGYDANNLFHMNWGWGGYSNGYYSLDNLNGGGYQFNSYNEALIGIQPLNATCVASTKLDTTICTASHMSGKLIVKTTTDTNCVVTKDTLQRCVCSIDTIYKTDTCYLGHIKRMAIWNCSTGTYGAYKTIDSTCQKMPCSPVSNIKTSITETYKLVNGRMSVLLKANNTGGTNYTYKWFKNGVWHPAWKTQSLTFQSKIADKVTFVSDSIAIGDIVSVEVGSSSLKCFTSGTNSITITNTSHTVTLEGIVDAPSITNLFIVYPNPNRGNINVVFQAEASAVNVVIYNYLGQVVYTNYLPSVSIDDTYIIPTSITGIYFVKCFQNNGVMFTKQVIVE